MIIAELIPPSFFQGQGETILWLISAGAIAILVYGADRLVSAAAKLAAALGLSKVIIGATVVSLGTTSPEAAVSVNAAFNGDAGYALGNGVGSIICDTALIFGLCCCLTRLPKDRFILKRHGWLQLGSGALLTAVVLVLWAISGDMNQVVISRKIGVGFVLLLVLYMYLSVRWSRQHPEIIPEEAKAELKTNGKGSQTLVNLLLLVFGLALVVAGSELLIGSMKVIATNHHVPDAVIAATLVAFGTSLPELVTAIAAIVKGHPELLVGNIIGADILNVLFVIGVSAVAAPLEVEEHFFTLLLPVMMIVLVMLRVFIFLPGKRFSRWQGIPLLASYVVFVALAIMMGVQGD